MPRPSRPLDLALRRRFGALFRARFAVARFLFRLVATLAPSLCLLFRIPLGGLLLATG